jgi:hypothetical protein
MDTGTSVQVIAYIVMGVWFIFKMDKATTILSTKMEALADRLVDVIRRIDKHEDLHRVHQKEIASHQAEIASLKEHKPVRTK